MIRLEEFVGVDKSRCSEKESQEPARDDSPESAFAGRSWRERLHNGKVSFQINTDKKKTSIEYLTWLIYLRNLRFILLTIYPVIVIG